MQLLRMRHLVDKLSMSKSAIRKLLREGEFPKPTKIGTNIHVWTEETIDEWFKAKERGVLFKPNLPHDKER